MPLGPNPVEDISARKQEIARSLFDRLMVSTIPLTDLEIDFFSTHLAPRAEIAEMWRRARDQWVEAGRPGLGEDTPLTGTRVDEFPTRIRQELYRIGWGIMAEQPSIPEGRIASLYGFFHPLDFGTSYVMAQVGEWQFVRDYCTEGRTIVAKGGPGSGKTQLVIADLARTAHLKDEHIADPSSSRLERMRLRANRFFRATGTFGEGPSIEREEKADAPARRGKARELDIVVAKDVRFVTNLSLTGNPDNPSPVLKRNIPVSRVSGAMLEPCLLTRSEAIEDRTLPILVFDEYDSAAPATRTSSTEGRAHLELWRQHRHLGASMVVIGHGEKGGIPREIFERANTIIDKIDKYEGLFFVAGFLNFKRFSDVDAPDIPYNPHGSSTLVPDLVPTQVIKAMSDERDMAMTVGEEWTHSREIQSIIDNIVAFQIGDEKRRTKRDGLLLAHIRSLMDKGAKDAAIAAEVAPEAGRDPDTVEATLVRFVRRQFNEEHEKRSRSRRPLERSEFIDQVRATRDQSVEEMLGAK